MPERHGIRTPQSEHFDVHNYCTADRFESTDCASPVPNTYAHLENRTASSAESACHTYASCCVVASGRVRVLAGNLRFPLFLLLGLLTHGLRRRLRWVVAVF